MLRIAHRTEKSRERESEKNEQTKGATEQIRIFINFLSLHLCSHPHSSSSSWWSLSSSSKWIWDNVVAFFSSFTLFLLISSHFFAPFFAFGYFSFNTQFVCHRLHEKSSQDNSVVYMYVITVCACVCGFTTSQLERITIS